MSIRLASPRKAIRNRMDICEVEEACALPANDNGAKHTSDATLHAALRHFAQHGLAAAKHARKQAEAANADGDAQAFTYWRDICHALDRPMARKLDRSVGKSAGNAQSQVKRS